jgi:hypothetical protein
MFKDKVNFFIADPITMKLSLNDFYDYDIVPHSLYLGTDEEEILEVGPYLVELKNEKVINWIVRNSGKNWGIFLDSRLEKDKLIKELQKLILVKRNEGKQDYFRFYDPRVMMKYIPSSSLEQLNTLFGKHANSIICETESKEIYVKYTYQKEKLKIEKIQVEKEKKTISNKDELKNISKKTEQKIDFNTLV